MKRFTILALAGALAVVGCSKKVENQERAAEASQSVAKTVASSLGSAGKGLAPALIARAAGAAYTHGSDIGMTWDGTYYVRTETHDGATWTMKLQMQDANGTSLGDVWNTHTSTSAFNPTGADYSWFTNWKKTRILATGTNADGLASSMDMTVTMTITTSGTLGGADYSTTVDMTMAGSGTHKDSKNKVDMAMSMPSMTFKSVTGATGATTTTGPDGTVTISGTVDEKTVAGSITFVNGVGDGTFTVNDETVKIHINADGSGNWEDSKGEKHDFKADS